MPISKYFKGSGDKVMSSMQKEYGDKKGKSVFYATANKQGMKPAGESKYVAPKSPKPKAAPKGPSAGKSHLPSTHKRGNIKRG